MSRSVAVKVSISSSSFQASIGHLHHHLTRKDVEGLVGMSGKQGTRAALKADASSDFIFTRDEFKQRARTVDSWY